MRKGRILIGTSNVVVPGNKSSFPVAFRAKSRLNYYASLFNTVEVNSSFYKTPQYRTYEKWVNDTPQDFRFTIKLSKEITHTKELKQPSGFMEQFMQAANGVGDKKGCLLIQFPGKITLDHFSQVERILEEVDSFNTGRQWDIAVEYRHTSWYTGETWEMLDQFGAAMVLQDIPKAKMDEVRDQASFVYQRFHGPTGDYRGSYTDEFLKTKAKQIRLWVKEGRDVYVYFNNTIGSAFENAVKLKSYLKF